MKSALKLVLACAPMIFVAACGGGSDLADRLDVADPSVRFVHASETAGNLTLNVAGQPQSLATTNTAYPFASNLDYGISTSAADWTITTAIGNVPVGNSVNIDPKRGNRYTLVAVRSATNTTGLYLIDDPYNKAVNSTSTHLRVMNASFNTPGIDVYMNDPAADFTATTVAPLIAGTAFNTAGPASGSDSRDIPGGTYQLRITTAGTKTVLFSGPLTFGDNQDVLILTVPDATAPSGIRALVKVEGTGAITAPVPNGL